MELYQRPFYGSDEGMNGEAGRLKKALYVIFDELSWLTEDIDMMDIADMMTRELMSFPDVVDDLTSVFDGPENPVVRASVIAERLEAIKECSADDTLIDCIGDDMPDVCEAIESMLVKKYGFEYCKEIVKVIPEDCSNAALCVASAIDQHLTTSTLSLIPSVDDLICEIREIMDGGIDDYFNDDSDDFTPISRESIFAAVSVPESRREEFMKMVRETDEESPDGYKYSSAHLSREAQRMMIEGENPED
jgi:hypothetical protein